MEPHISLGQILCDQRIRILVVDDRSHFRGLIRQMIDSEADMMVIGEADDECSAIEEARALRPDLVVMNLSLPIVTGIIAMKRLRMDCAGVRVILYTGFEEEIVFPHAIDAGASAVVFQSRIPDDLIQAIRSIPYR